MIKIKTDDNGCEYLIYNGIVFDDFVLWNEWDGYDDQFGWSQICDNCISTHQIGVVTLPNKKKMDILDDAGSGICGVKGCDNESDNYIDFPHHTESEAA